MKLFFDARYIRTDFHDGISRYSAELGSALAALTPVTFLICDKVQLKSLPEHAKYLLIHKPTDVREPLTSVILNRYNPDVIFSPMQTMGSVGRQFKLVLTLHDLIYYRHRTPPHHLNPLIRLGWRAFHLTYMPQRLTLNNADIVATVSETSKQEFEAINLTKRPIVVTPNAPQKLSEYLSTPVKISAAPKNLVYMGSFMGYKNVETLIRGMEFLPGRTLHLLSRIQPEQKAELQKIIPKGVNVIFHGGVSDQQYAEILANDAILVSASRSEGYGLPLAEALALGVPAVVSDLTIHQEVAGKGALYFNPDHPKDFANQIKKLDDATATRALVEKGKGHIAQFNWKTSAQTLLDAIRKL